MCECKRVIDLIQLQDFHNYAEIYGNDPDNFILGIRENNDLYKNNEKFYTLNVDFFQNKKQCGYAIFEIKYCPFCGEKLND